MGKGASTFNISLKLLDQNFKKGISGIQKQIRGLGNFIKGAFALGSITAFGKQMIQVATDFEDAMARVKAVSNASADELKMMSDEARKMGATTRYTAIEAAQSLENLTRNGMSATEATRALSGTMQLAQANALGLAEAADIVSNTLNIFGLSATEVTRVNDVLSAVASTTATNVSQIYAALVNAGPAAVSLGLSLEETAAAIGAFAQRGVKAEQAGTSLRQAMLKLVEPKTVDKMKEFGIDIDENVIKSEGLVGALKRLSEAGLSTSQAMSIFGTKSGNAIITLVSAFKDLELELEITKNASGTTMRMFEEGVGTTRGAVDTLKSTYESFLLSLGQKSNSVFTGVIKFLTNLVKNFNTLGGTLVNIGAVVIPMMTKKITALATTWSVFTKKAAAEAASLKVAMGDWISLIVTAVTWIGTYLYTSMSKVNTEIKDLKTEISKTGDNLNVMKGQIDTLLDTLGPETDTTTLAGVVSELTRMFPDFKEEIHKAALEAGETGEWDKLKKVLYEIAELQSIVMANDQMQQLVGSYYEKIAENVLKRSRRANDTGIMEEYLIKAINERVVELASGVDKKSYRTSQLTAMIKLASNAKDEEAAFKAVKDYCTRMGIKAGEGVIKGFVHNLFTDDKSFAELRNSLQAIRDGVKEEADLRKSITGTLKEEDDNEEENKNKNKNKNKDDDDDDNDRKNRAKTVADIEKRYKEAIEDAEDDFRRAGGGAEALHDKLMACARAATDAYEQFRSLTRKTGSANPYEQKEKEAVQALKAAGLYPSAVSTSGSLLGPNQITYPYIKRGDKNVNKNQLKDANRPAPGPFPFSYEPDWRDYAVYTDEAIALTGTFTNSLSSLQSAFDTLSSSDATWIDKLSAASRVLETIEDAVIGTVNIISKLGDTELLAAKKEAIASALSRKNKKKDIAADTTKAVTGAAASQASIPYIGPILAIAAVATILGLIAASSQKFAKGGIVQGNSKYGDKLLARVNAGEAILNQRQQKRLLDIADGRAGGGVGNVSFHIAGKDLVGVLRNNSTATARISGSKGM